MRAPVRESPHESPAPPLSCFTGAHLIPVGPITSPTITSSHLGAWRRSGVDGSRRHKVMEVRTQAKEKVKASRTKVKVL